MHRSLSILLACALALATPAFSTEPSAQATAMPSDNEARPAAPDAKPAAPQNQDATKPATAPSEDAKPPAPPDKDAKPAQPPAGEEKKTPPPHIALLLPIKSASLGHAAEIVRLGFAAASQADRTAKLPIQLYETGDEAADVVASYRSAIEGGAKVVVGPLTRGGVSAVISSGLTKVPTLALNAPDSPAVLPPGLCVFGILAEAEARQVARLAAGGERRQAVIVYADTGVDRRMRQAFAEEWADLGRTLASEYLFSGEAAELPRLKQSVGTNPEQIVFLALDAANARLVKPFIDASVPVFATSQVNVGRVDPLVQFDLGGVHFVDMPWLLQPDHPAVMIYPRLDPSPGNELERVYALGIDAFRLARLLGDGPRSGIQLDGVTGRITLGSDRYFSREPIPAQFRQGEIVVEEAPAR
jgi:uncharacterized protein